jgi:hypothetical protein
MPDPVKAMKAYARRRRSMAPLVLNLGTKWRKMVESKPRLPYSEKEL